MKTIGLIGGSTWVSTIDYYKYINQFVNQKLGGVHSAKILLYSFNFNFLKTNAEKGDWETIAKRIIKESQRLVQSGADCIVLCANTLHCIAEHVQQNISVPLIHIAEATGQCIANQGITKVGLLGTKFTMEEDFYHASLKKFGIHCLIPEAKEREEIHRIIFYELSKNRIEPQSKENILQAIGSLKNKGVEAIVLACTELPLIVKKEDSSLPLIDTTLVHAKAVVDCIIN